MEPYVIVGWPAFSLGFPPEFLSKSGGWTQSLTEAKRFESWNDANKDIEKDKRESFYKEPMMITRAYVMKGISEGRLPPETNWMEMDWRWI